MTASDFYLQTPEAQSARVARLGRRALAAWGIRAESLELLKYRENAVFRVVAQDGRQYALRIHRAGYHSDAELRSELEWMRALSEDGFDVPTLVLHGEDDQIVPVHDSARKSAKLIKGAKTIYYPGAPHGITATHQDQINAELLAFLRS